jgi:Phosphopantetheine attachment site
MTEEDDDVMHRREVVRTMIGEVIGNPDVALLDEFFAAGGHSLLIMPVVHRLKVEHGLVLDPRSFIVNAQIWALAEACHPIMAKERELG